MTTFNLPLAGQAIQLRLPTLREVRAMLMRPVVACFAIAAGLIAFLAVLGGVVFLAYLGKSTDAVTGLLGGSLLVLLLNLRSQIKDVNSKVDQITTTGGN